MVPCWMLGLLWRLFKNHREEHMSRSVEWQKIKFSFIPQIFIKRQLYIRHGSWYWGVNSEQNNKSLPSKRLQSSVYFSHGSVQFSSIAQSCLTLYDITGCSTPGPPSITNSQHLLKLMSIMVMPSSHLILCRPLLLLPLIFPSIRVFSNESALRIRWPKYWSFSFSISPFSEHQDWFSSEWTGWISLQSKGLSRVFSNTTVQKHQYFGAQLSL